MKNAIAIERIEDSKYLGMYDDTPWTDNTEDAWLFQSVAYATRFIIDHNLQEIARVVNITHRVS